MSKTVLTEEGKKKIIDELNYLSNEEKVRLVGELSDAREQGNLEENSEYMIAKEQFEKLQEKINKLQSILSTAVIVSSSDINTDSVSILCKVKVLNTNNGKEMSFTIVPENEIDIKNGKISPISPIGAGLMNKKLGEVCQIKTPAGTFEFKILDISL